MKNRTKAMKNKDNCGDSINSGRNYKEYLKEYNRKTRGDAKKRMKQAKDTIKRIRESEGYIEGLKSKDFDFDFF